MSELQNRGNIAVLGGSVGSGGGSGEIQALGGFVVAGNVAITSIAATNTFYDLSLGAGGVLSSNAVLWSLSDLAAGEITYTGTEPFSGTFVGSISFESDGTSSLWSFRVVINGSPLTEGALSQAQVGSSPREASVVVPLSVVTGDTVRIQVENQTDLIDLLVHNVSFQVFGSAPSLGAGDVVGPALATNDALVRYDGTTGKSIKNSPNLLYDGVDVTLGGKILARKAVNEVEVFSASDLPTPSGGVITLPSGVYLLKDSIAIADPLKVGAGATVEFTSLGLGATITYTGTAPFLQSDLTAEFFIFERMNFVLTEDNVELFDTDGPAILLDRLVVLFTGTGAGLGTSLNHNLAFSARSSLVSGFTEGLTITGSPLFLLSDIEFRSPVAGATPLFSINGGTTTAQCSNLTVTAHASDDVFDFDGAFAGIATLSQVRVMGGASFFAAGSLDETSPRVEVTASPPQKSSMNIGFVVASGVAVDTVISTIGVFVDLNLDALAVAGSNIELWSVTDTTTGELTYNGLTPFNGTLIAAFTASSQGSAEEFEFRAVKNGSVMPDDIMAAREIANSSASITLIAPVSAEPGDTIRMQVANNDSTTNVEISQLTAQVS